MPNARTAYYTTDEDFRPVISNHINKVKYDKESKTLYMEFYNGAKYSFYGLPEDLYLGMMASASQGTFFYHNIRQAFPYKRHTEDILANTRESPKKASIITKINPELAKLDTLDEQEKELNKEFKRGDISSDEYYNTLNSMEIKRDKLIKALEKKGYFQDEIEEEEELETLEEHSISFGEGFIAVVSTLSDVALVFLKVALSLIGMFFGLATVFMKK